jgi:hypothetical protein
MFSSPIAYAWLAWLLIVVAVVVLRFSVQRQKQRQKSRTTASANPDSVAPGEPHQARSSASLKGKPRVAEPADYREQLIAAGIIHPATELSAPDPATEA